jgi:DNA invertase Pin-like site-specific DNA recombinase
MKTTTSTNAQVSAQPESFSARRSEVSLRPAKIRDEHLTRPAFLYIRQSTGHQIADHPESTDRQYALADRIIDYGWHSANVVVIDEDLGLSGSGRVERAGFRRLMEAVTTGQAGLVMGLEMSRLARNSRDWHGLFEVCGVFDTLLADEDGVYDPHDPNDRLVLGLKGLISEMELHTMKLRLERGRFNKARRGELFHSVPRGYIKSLNGSPEKDPDQQVQTVIALPPHEWKVLIKDCLPGYITWQQYETNLLRLEQNRFVGTQPGPSRPGQTLLAGLLRCGQCGRRMQVTASIEYSGSYVCTRASTMAVPSGQHCPAVNCKVVDTLVAATLEKAWEAALSAQQEVEQNRTDSLRDSLHELSASEVKQLQDLSLNIPQLWNHTTTTNVDRREIARLVIEHVVVCVEDSSEQFAVTIHWSGGYESRHARVRPVATYDQLTTLPEILALVIEHRRAGSRAPEIASALNAAGHRTAKRRAEFTEDMVRCLLQRDEVQEAVERRSLRESEWEVSTLAERLGMPRKKLKDWVTRGWLHAVQRPFGGRWIVWADTADLKRLQMLAARSRKGAAGHAPELTTPRFRPAAE